jgi:hypothetical protein
MNSPESFEKKFIARDVAGNPNKEELGNRDNSVGDAFLLVAMDL